MELDPRGSIPRGIPGRDGSLVILNHTLYDHASLKKGWGASRERYGPNYALRGQKPCNATVWEIAGLDAGLRSRI
jgi:hypothetical protein